MFASISREIGTLIFSNHLSRSLRLLSKTREVHRALVLDRPEAPHKLHTVAFIHTKHKWKPLIFAYLQIFYNHETFKLVFTTLSV